MLNSGPGFFPYSGYYKEELPPFTNSIPLPEAPEPIRSIDTLLRNSKKHLDSVMYMPQKFVSSASYLNPATTICPVTHLDINSVGVVKENKSLDFTTVDGTYKQTVFLVISRLPIGPEDPNTYVALPPDYLPNKSKVFANYSFAAISNGSNIANDSTEDKEEPEKDGAAVPSENVGSTPEPTTLSASPGERLPFGSNLNPLLPDPYRYVQVTPGCLNEYVKIKNGVTSETNTSRKLWGKKSTNPNAEALKPPKTSIVRNSSTFLSRALPVENFSKKIQTFDTLIFNSHGKAFNLFGVKPNTIARIGHVKELVEDTPLIRIVFTSTITCLASRLSSSSGTGLDILLGFASGDIFWYDPYVNKYGRFNKNGKLVNGSGVMDLKWYNEGKNFIAVFKDGSILCFSRNLEDDENHYYNVIKDSKSESHNKFLRVLKSAGQISTTNPIAHYKISSQPLTSISFSTNNANVVSVTGNDGYLRILDISTEFVTDIIPSYFSSLICSAWSQDGKYLAIGGQDDLVSIYEVGGTKDLKNKTGVGYRLVARLEGHCSWIRAISFDYAKSPPHLIATPTTYRIGSVADDGRLLLWDFSPRLLPKVKQLAKRFQHKNAGRKRSNTVASNNNIQLPQGSNLRSLAQAMATARLIGKLDDERSRSRNSYVASQVVVHEVKLKNLIPFVPPMVSVDCQLGRLSGVQFTEDGIWVVSAGGDVRKWDRP